MSVSVCPIAVIAAPLDRVWAMLADPSRYDLWWDAHTDVIVPQGPVQPGQTVYAHTYGFGRRWTVTTVVEQIDAARHCIQLTTTLPLGIIGHNQLMATAVDGASTRVAFG
jgi:hypothetical protein